MTFWNGLRIHDEPYRYIGEREVFDTLTVEPAAYVDFLDGSFAALAHGDIPLILPVKSVYSDAAAKEYGGIAGDFRVMTCTTGSGPEAFKTVKIVGTNNEGTVIPDQITVGKAFRIHPTANFITHIVEACLFSSARTGACAALAIKKTIGEGAQRIGVIGSGRVGYFAALYAGSLEATESVVLTDIDNRRASGAAASLAGGDHGSGPAGRCVAGNFAEAIDADVVIIATNATEPVLNPEDTAARLVISLGADIDGQSELNPQWSAVAGIVVDGADTLEVADAAAWIREGRLSKSDVRDLLSVYRGEPPPHLRDRTVFLSTGSALLDNLTMQYLLRDEAR